jgi:hypothetical protein
MIRRDVACYVLLAPFGNAQEDVASNVSTTRTAEGDCPHMNKHGL